MRNEYFWVLRDLYIDGLDIDGGCKGAGHKTIEIALNAARKVATQYPEMVMIDIHKVSIDAEDLGEGSVVYSAPSGPTPEELDIRIPDRHGVFSWIARELETGKIIGSGSGCRSVREAVRHAKTAHRSSLLSYMCGESVYEIYEDEKLIHVQDEYDYDLSDLDIDSLDCSQKRSLDELITAIVEGSRERRHVMLK